MKGIVFTFLIGCMAGSSFAQDIFAYNDKVANKTNVGVFGGLAVNSSSNFIKRQDGYSHTAKGALSTVPTFGAYLQAGLGQRLSLRGSLSFGYSSYAYKYSQIFDSLTDNFTPANTKKFDKYTKVKHGSAFVMPQIDIGYLFGPFKKIYLIEARGGIGFHAYLGENNDSVITASGKIADPKNRYTYPYHSYEKAKYGGPDAWGSLVANVYIGIRWSLTTSDFLNHSSLGLQAMLPVYTQSVGYAEIEYRNDNDMFTKERVDLGLLNVGIRFTYSFL